MSDQRQHTPFPAALMRERARFKHTRTAIADQCGVSEKIVERWEKGDAIPSRQQFKRLVGILPRMAPHFPVWDSIAGEALFGGETEDREHNKAVLDRMLQVQPEAPRPPPDQFGVGLKRVREENGVSQEELGEILGVAQGTVSRWEGETNPPVVENLDKLFEVLPELKAGIETGAIKRPPSRAIESPVGNRFPTRLGAALEMVIRQSDEERDRPPYVPPKHEAPVIEPSEEEEPDELATLAIAHAEARVASWKAKRASFAALEAYQKAQQALEDAEREEHAAHERLDAAISREVDGVGEEDGQG